MQQNLDNHYFLQRKVMFCSNYVLHTAVDYNKVDFLVSAVLFDVFRTFRQTQHFLSSGEFIVLVCKLRTSFHFEDFGIFCNPI
jgi:hypothetical protein